MIVSKLVVKAFKSILDLTMPLDPQITVLIGPNESGKSNILQAIEAFRLNAPYSTDMTCQYSEYYSQGRYPEVTLEFSDIAPDQRQEMVAIHEAFEEVDSFQVKKVGPQPTDYRLLIQGEEIPLPDPRRLFRLLPEILLFKDVPLLKSTISIWDLERGDSSYEVERNLLRVGGVRDFKLIFEDSTRGRRTREEVSRNLTEQIRRIWAQEPSLEVRISVNGDILHIDISDETTVFDAAETRSLGFLWFFSFYIQFMGHTLNNHPHQHIFLIEEPGIHLHPSGQKDLVRLLEILAQHHQLIYTTHSPFMINREFPERVRLVSRGKNGTEVDSRAYRENWRPLRTSIGLMIGDLFFFGDSGVLVEVPAKKLPFIGHMKKMKLWRDETSKH